MTDYTDLQTTLANWLHRSDLTSVIPQFIQLGESRIKRRLNAKDREVDTTLTATIGSRYIALPSNHIRPIQLWNTYYSKREVIQFVKPSNLELFTSTGYPTAWTIDGTNIAFNIVADLAYTYTFRYVKDLSLATDGTNWLVTKFLDVYLYASLIYAAAYIRDADLGTVAFNEFERACEEASNYINRDNMLGNASLDAGIPNYTRSNIITGE